MKDGFKVFDSDMHVLEPVDLWERYIDPSFRHRAPRGTQRKTTDVGVTVDGADQFLLSAQIARVSFPGGLDPAFSAAIARAYNDWLADFCKAGDPRRMYGAAMLPVQDVGASIREARRAVMDLGFKAVFLRPNPPRPGVYW